MSKLFARRLIGTLVCVAILFASLVGFIFTRPAVSAEADSSLLTDWTVEENATTPQVDKLITQSKAQATEYEMSGDQIAQTSIDERSGVKLVSKKTGTEAKGSDFYFTGTQNGNFEVDFRILSEHTARGTFNYTGGESEDLDDLTAEINPYADVVKVGFTFKDSNTGKEVTLHLLSSQRNRIATVSAYVTLDSVENFGEDNFLAIRYSDDDATKLYTLNNNEQPNVAGANKNDNYYYPTTLWKTSFSNAYSYWNTCGNDSVLPSIIGFDPETMQIYGMARRSWQAAHADPIKIVILDLDDPKFMMGYEENFDAGDFKGEYTVKFSVERMTPNDTEVALSTDGEAITYDRYATMMLYEVNGEPATAASVAEYPPVQLSLKLDETETDAELYEPFTIPTPEVTIDDVADTFEGGTIAVTGPDSKPVTYDEDTLQFTPDQKGEYRIAYTLTKQGATSTATLVLTAADTTVPQITINSGVVNDYAWKSDLSVTFGTEDVTATDASGKAEVTVSAVDSANRPVTSPLSDIGRYTITYTATDANGLTSKISRTITISDQTDPVISESFEFAEKITLGEEITLPSVTATDDITQNLTVSLKITLDGQEVAYTGTVFKPEQAGTYTFEWTVSDAAGNSDKVTKTLVVSEKPDNNSNTWIWIVVGVVAAVVVIGAVVAVVVVKKKKNNNNTQA